MMGLAGKYGNMLLNNPAALMATGGVTAAGLATAGNLGAEPDKSGGRVALEALGAGALGAAAARGIPGIAKYYSPGATKQRFKDVGQDMSDAGMFMSPKEVEDYAQIAAIASKAAPYAGAAVTAGLIGGAGALGGQLGGGVANVGNMAGLGIDPESPGSSNTTNSRMSMQGGGYMQSMAEDIGAMRERSDQREQERNLQKLGTAAVAVGTLGGIGALGLSARNRSR